MTGPRPAVLLAGPGRPRGASAASFREASGQRGGGRAWAVLAGAARRGLACGSGTGCALRRPAGGRGWARREVGGAPKLGSLARPAPAAASPQGARCCGRGRWIRGSPKRSERGGAAGGRRWRPVSGQPARSPAGGQAPSGVRRAPWALPVAEPGWGRSEWIPRGWWRWLG